MHLKSIQICRFRKFGDKSNIIKFIKPKSDSDIETTISLSSTLIVGKNNSGKTTIAKAIELLHSDTEILSGNDFNYNYISKLLNEYKSNQFNNYPECSFKLTFGVNIESDNLTNIQSAISISQAKEDIKNLDFSIDFKFEIKNKIEFIERIKKLIEKNKNSNKEKLFRKFIKEISSTKYKRRSFDSESNEINIKPSDLIKLKSISAASNIHDRTLLSKSFNKIIKFKYENEENNYSSINEIVEKNNDNITKSVKQTHQNTIQNVLDNIVSNESLGIALRADLTFDRLMTDLITYEHQEGDYFVPEGQFGLGYANLISIVSEIIDYVERNPIDEESSKVRLICIEEPETFMHPQMQVNFIKHISETIDVILGDDNNIKSQIIITTHSAHILNSKIHSSGSLDYINYILPINNNSECVVLEDKNISDKTGTKNEFYFIKKHIKHQVPELFFSDAIIFVEGITEERVINFYIENDNNLNKKMISVFRIDGAHGKVYSNLVSQLKIPSLIITDIDFKRTKEELTKKVKVEGQDEYTNINIYPQMKKITNKLKSTNKTLQHFYNSDLVDNYKEFYTNDFFKVVFQKDPINIKISDDIDEIFYATSFEEAMILENYNNELLRNVVKSVIKDIYTSIIPNDNKDYYKLAINSFRLQKALSENKSNFANKIIYDLVTNSSITETPLLPLYIREGIEWLKNKIK